MQNIHPSAIISEQAELADNVTVGPYAIIEADVKIGEGTSIGPHAVIKGHTRIGAHNQIHAHAVLGDLPQHQAFESGTISGLQIGDNNTIREMVTMHRALHPSTDTIVGSHNLFMTNSHIGHDCILQDHVVITNSTAVGGHVEIGEHAIVGGLVGVHQFVRIGAYSMTAASTMIRKDVLPYAMLGGEPARHYRLNTIGLRRNGVSGDRYRQLEKMFRALREGQEITPGDTVETQYLYEWLQKPSERGLSGFQKGKN